MSVCYCKISSCQRRYKRNCWSLITVDYRLHATQCPCCHEYDKRFSHCWLLQHPELCRCVSWPTLTLRQLLQNYVSLCDESRIGNAPRQRTALVICHHGNAAPLVCLSVDSISYRRRSACRIVADAIIPSTTVRDLGIYIDADLSMRSHARQTVTRCFAVLRQPRSIRDDQFELFTGLCLGICLISWDRCRLAVDFDRQLPINLVKVK